MRDKILLIAVALCASCSQKRLGPIILNTSPTVRSGEAFYVQGQGFGANPHLQISYDEVTWKQLVPLLMAETLITARLPPKDNPSIEMVSVRVSKDGKNWSAPAFLNRARPVHFGTDEVAPGATVRVFGRNLYFLKTPAARFVDIDSGASLKAVATGQSERHYELLVEAPADLVPGHSYSLYISNGLRGPNDESSEAKADNVLKCRRSGIDPWKLGVPWASDFVFASNTINVKEDSRLSLHAKGNGSTNDVFAIREAVDTASKLGGGIVYLPPGNYKIEYPNGCGIGLQSRVVLAGAGASRTTVSYGYGPAPKSGGYAVCFAPELSGLVDLTFNNVNEQGHWPQSALANGSKKLFLQRVNWNIGTSQWLSLTNSDYLALENSSITQGISAEYNCNGPLLLNGSKHFLVQGNSIKYAVWGLDLGNMSDGVFEGNTIIRDATKPIPAACVTHVLSASFSSQLAVLNNAFKVDGALRPGNDGETINSEGGGPNRKSEVHGIIESAQATTITVGNAEFPAAAPDPYTNLKPAIVLVSGEGAGQWRTVLQVSTDRHSLSIESPWAVVPKKGDRYSFVHWSASDWVIAGNAMSDNQKGIEFFNASIRDILITRNTMNDNGGILISPDQRAEEFNVAYGVDISDNAIADKKGVRPAHISIVPREDAQNMSFGTAVLGLDIRRNQLIASSPNTRVEHTDDEKAVVEGFNCYWQWQTATSKLKNAFSPVIFGAVFQHNGVTNSDTAFYLNSGSYHTTIDATAMQDVHSVLRDEVVPGASHASVGTVIARTSTLAHSDALRKFQRPLALLRRIP
jgi:hypothetical protein